MGWVTVFPQEPNWLRFDNSHSLNSVPPPARPQHIEMRSCTQTFSPPMELPDHGDTIGNASHRAFQRTTASTIAIPLLIPTRPIRFKMHPEL